MWQKLPSRQIMMNEYLHGTGKSIVEVGVALGFFSDYLHSIGPSHLYLIDPWEQQSNDIYPDKNNKDNTIQEIRYDNINQKFGHHSNVTIIREYSPQATRHFSPNSIDIVYIDANHSEEAAYTDLNAWWEIVKPNGWLSGHDLKIGVGVYPAVTRFIKERNTDIRYITKGILKSYAIQKP